MTTSHQPTAKCLRPGCGRTLRAKASVACGYGPVCRARIRAAALAEAVRGFAAAQVEKARELIADGGLVPFTRPGIFQAASSKGDGTVYLVSATGACNCPAGLRSGKADRCYHVAAARMVALTVKAA